MNEEEARRQIQQEFRVSRETMEHISIFAELLQNWTKKINLISSSSVAEIWRRHILDSAQIFPDLIASDKIHVDLGSGAGFPGLVLSILGKGQDFPIETRLIEADQRKSAFLGKVIGQLGLNARIIPKRIAEVEPISANIVTARALAPLPKLLDHTHRHLATDGRAVFLKGENAEAEIEEALDLWRFRHQKRPSCTNPKSVVLTITELEPK